ncbi:IS1634 family transposase, partial [Candidatus Gottesmanbacteria bacterium]|nr:IS1634 family transposase [Candidatus Gottesmanbacteria bacterium]
MRIRKTKTKSGATAVQVVESRYGQTLVRKHIGSAWTPEALHRLQEEARSRMLKASKQQSLFSRESSFDPLFSRYRYIGTRYTLLYETILSVLTTLGFSHLTDTLWVDLVLMRVVEPGSKRESVNRLKELFGISYDLTRVYKHLLIIASRKDEVEALLVAFARRELHADFSFVLYDVTTLYFESFTPEELKQCGLSKDNKSMQPQIVVGLLATSDGFPLTYDLFAGNTFEGHTMIPVVTGLVKRYHVTNLTVVADAAMVSQANIDALTIAGISYIVGARLGYLTRAQVEEISHALDGRDGASVRLTISGKTLICDFSKKRYTKNKSDTEKQIKKATDIVERNVPMKRHRFLTQEQTQMTLNQTLIDRAKLLWGIKGYVANIDVSNEVVVARYHDLWHVEHSFRMAKSDLLSRPIFHYKQDAIKAHLLICIMALAAG